MALRISSEQIGHNPEIVRQLLQVFVRRTSLAASENWLGACVCLIAEIVRRCIKRWPMACITTLIWDCAEGNDRVGSVWFMVYVYLGKALGDESEAHLEFVCAIYQSKIGQGGHGLCVWCPLHRNKTAQGGGIMVCWSNFGGVKARQGCW